MAPSTDSILAQAREGTNAAVAGRVFGTPVEKDGVTVIPVAVVSGGGGGGSGSGKAAAAAQESTGGEPDGKPEGEGSGGGFGFSARPAGVYVIKDGKVSWQPAVNVNAIVAGGQLVLLAAFLVARSILRGRR
ncbi:spore germination protein GerW family protein [Actinoplanes sp. NPDC023714]|uniref:spore germination protein GerW family protein n=1 Tax=Actinoplanes sp. NPDC023714 TaxID=3154322 RepID=UPI0033CBAA71